MRNTHFIAEPWDAQGALRIPHFRPKIGRMKTGQKIRQIRKAKGLKISEVENRAGLSEGNLSRVERGVQWLSEEKLFAVADALGVNAAEFFEPEGTNFVAPDGVAGKLPLISWVQAGNWSEVIDNFQPGDAEEWIPVPFKHGPNAFILKVVGKSNYDPTGEKSYDDGDYIAVDPSKEPRHKSMVIVRLDDDNTATFKQLWIEPDGKQFLVALNPQWPRRIIEINDNATIVGVVIGKWTPE